MDRVETQKAFCKPSALIEINLGLCGCGPAPL
jgi:hypothetical protein